MRHEYQRDFSNGVETDKDKECSKFSTQSIQDLILKI